MPPNVKNMWTIYLKKKALDQMHEDEMNVN